jgi:hypothetical protein
MRCEPSGNVMRIKFSGLDSGWDVAGQVGDRIGSRRRVRGCCRAAVEDLRGNHLERAVSCLLDALSMRHGRG